jgi:hypothetical protein
MKNGTMAAFLAAAMILALGCTGNGANPQGDLNSGQLKFTDSPDYPYAYLISGDTLDANATQALAGFELQKQQMADGSLNITLKALSPEYTDQDYIVKPGQKLYFIERSLRDDSDGEHNTHDDTAVIVDAGGYVVHQ